MFFLIQIIISDLELLFLSTEVKTSLAHRAAKGNRKRLIMMKLVTDKHEFSSQGLDFDIELSSFRKFSFSA